MKKLAPICLFTYNRLEETKHTVKALQNNFLAKESDLFIFSDGSKNNRDKTKVSILRKYLRTIDSFKSVTLFESTNNNGLANSIINGVTQIINQHKKVIVLEDDLISTPNFLNFMNQALDFYKGKDRIQSINGYSLKIKIDEDVYFHQRTFPWGWATWNDRWSQSLFDKDQINKKIKMNKYLLKNFNKMSGNDMSSMLQDSLTGKNNSWYIRWVLDHFIDNTYAVFPTLSKITNIGFVDDGTHCNGINSYICELDKEYKTTFSFVNFKELGKDSNRQFLRFFKKRYKFLFRIKLLRYKYGRIQIKREIIDRFF